MSGAVNKISGLLFGGNNSSSFGGSADTSAITQYTGILNQTSLVGTPIPIVYGQSKISANLLWYGDFTATAVYQTSSTGGGGKGGHSSGSTTSTLTGYNYSASMIMALCEGLIAGIPRIWEGKTIYSSDSISSACFKTGFNFFNGDLGQRPWSYVATKYPDQSLSYSLVSYLAVANYAMGSSDAIPNFNYEIASNFRFNATSNINDENPSIIIKDYLTNPQYGAGLSSASFGDWSNYSNYLVANGIFFSVVYDTQNTASSDMDTLMQLTNSEVFFSEGVLKVVTYGDSAITGNGVTFTPNLTPVYDITYDDLQGDSGSDPIKCVIGRVSDAYNNVKLNFADRSTEYNPNSVSVDDLNSIRNFGFRPANPIDGTKHICDATVAANVAQILLQRVVYIRKTYEFKLGFKFVLLEPMDIVTLTEPSTGLNKTPVRITKIEEDEYGMYTVTAEQMPDGVATAALYPPRQPALGFRPDYNVPPGSVVIPVIFEAPVDLTIGGLQVWAAVTGNNPNWGGCVVYISFDNTTYTQLSTSKGGSRYGQILSTGSDLLDLTLSGNGGQLLSTDTVSAESLTSTLCYAGNLIEGEYFCYSTATLMAQNQYELQGLIRGAYRSNHTMGAGQNFVRVDDSVIKSQDLPLSIIGTVIYFKFCSFNVFGSGAEELSEVVAYPYTITGLMTKLPPPDITGFSATVISNGVQLNWTDVVDPIVHNYEIREGTDWSTGISLGFFQGSSTTLAALISANYSWMIKAQSIYSIESVNADVATLLTIIPSPLVVTAVVASANYVLSWVPPSSMFAIDHYSIGSGINALNITEFSKAKITQYQSQVNWVGNETFWVAAVDVAGNIGSYTSAQLTIAPPLTPLVTAQVVDNNVQLFWTDSTSTLPINLYKIYKGNTFATATLIGSKLGGFTSITETIGGNFTYWVLGIDSAGNLGLPGQLTTLVASPPNYILHSDIFSTFSGTKVNAVISFTGVAMPIDIASTYAQHFINNSWTTPQAQINAGFPIYAEPTLANGYYEEVIDYGSTLTSTNVTVSPTINVISGSPTFQVMISSSNVSATGPWTDNPNTSAIYLTNFRWVKVRVTVTSPDQVSLILMSSLETKLSVSLKNDGGNVTVNASDTGGTRIYFNEPFVGVNSITLTPQGSSTPVTPMYDFEAGAFPTYFMAYLFNSTTGARVTGVVSWSAKGY